uniref:Uncharacterized protein n=1 Tax=Anguilla anguilla TaxID=7936 RepID=A0A0E9RQP7_ANGAN
MRISISSYLYCLSLCWYILGKGYSFLKIIYFPRSCCLFCKREHSQRWSYMFKS